jgi:hypothetical protein
MRVGFLEKALKMKVLKMGFLEENRILTFVVIVYMSFLLLVGIS